MEKQSEYGPREAFKLPNTTEFRKLHWNNANKRGKTYKLCIGKYKWAKQLPLKQSLYFYGESEQDDMTELNLRKCFPAAFIYEVQFLSYTCYFLVI